MNILINKCLLRMSAFTLVLPKSRFARYSVLRNVCVRPTIGSLLRGSLYSTSVLTLVYSLSKVN